MFTTIIYSLLIGLFSYFLYMLFSSKNVGWNADTLLPIFIMSAVSVLMISLLFSKENILTNPKAPDTEKTVFIERLDSIPYSSSKKNTEYSQTDSLILETYLPYDELLITPRKINFSTPQIQIR